jgi:hypothetical protein
MIFDFIFNSFSKRGKPVEPFVSDIPETFKNKILLFCRDTFSNKFNPCGSGNYLQTFWEEIRRIMLYRHGRLRLTETTSDLNSAQDAISFLLSCRNEEFFDFIEDIFRVECLFHVTHNENDLVAKINQLFSSDSMGYELTEMIKEKQVGETGFGRMSEVIVTIAWPQVIRKDDQTIHNTAIKPVLQFLSDPAFKTANIEYLEALEDFRKEDWGDSLTKCCSAYESVMKIICEKKKWKYAQADTVSPLIKTIIKNANLETHFEQPLVYIATLRNKYSKSHGAGTQPKKVTQGIARLGLNLTASAILFLARETL